MWYSFTAPEAGRYVFYTENEYSNFIYFALCARPDISTLVRDESCQSGKCVCAGTNYMEKGETIYIAMYTDSSKDEFTFPLRMAYQTAFVKNGDGSYTVPLSEGDSFTLRGRAGKSRFQIEVLEEAEVYYRLEAYYCPADHSEGDVSNGFMRIAKGYQGSSDTLLAGTYDMACMITYENRFVALVTGMEPFVIEGADSEEVVYVHDAVCEENSISLDLEPVVRNRHHMICRYMPVDGAGETKETVVDGWKTYVFDGLKTGTEYRFEFRDKDFDRLLKTFTYTTADPSVNIVDAAAAVSEDFSELVMKVKPDYQGTDGKVEVFCGLTDSFGRQRELLNKKVAVDKRDKQGYFTFTIDLAHARTCLKPGTVCSAQVSMSFLNADDEQVAVAAKTVDVEIPEQPFGEESDITTFTVEQIEPDGIFGTPQVRYNVRVQGKTGIKRAIIFYRFVGDKEYSGWPVSLEDVQGETACTGEGTITLPW